MRNILELSKIRITIAVGIASAAAFLMASQEVNITLVSVFFGTAFLSAGGSALNHYQDRFEDALMERTKRRPLPDGRMKEREVLLAALFFLVLGTLIFATQGLTTSLLVGWLAIFFYNVIYTPLKKRSPYALFPGAVVGALPPAIGWAGGGGSLASPAIFAVSLFFFIWQMPHFWLLNLMYKEDYKKASLPTLTDQLTESALSRLAFVWISALAVSATCLPFSLGLKNSFTLWGLAVASLWIALGSQKLLLHAVAEQSKLARLTAPRRLQAVSRLADGLILF